jgi:hypothetical protein
VSASLHSIDRNSSTVCIYLRDASATCLTCSHAHYVFQSYGRRRPKRSRTSVCLRYRCVLVHSRVMACAAIFGTFICGMRFACQYDVRQGAAVDAPSDPFGYATCYAIRYGPGPRALSQRRRLHQTLVPLNPSMYGADTRAFNMTDALSWLPA